MRRSICAGLLVVVLLGAGCGGDDGAASTSSKTTGSGGPAGCDVDGGDPDELAPLVVEVVPEGFGEQDAVSANSGPADLAKAADDDASEDGKELLTELGFSRGYQRVWINAAGQQLVTFLYEFCDEDGATGYRDHAEEVLTSDSDFEPFDVAGVDDAVGVSGDKVGRDMATIATSSGVYSVVVVATGRTGTVPLTELQARATALAAGQVDAL